MKEKTRNKRRHRSAEVRKKKKERSVIARIFNDSRKAQSDVNC